MPGVAQTGQGLQEYGGLACARLAPEEYCRAGQHAAAKHAVQFVDPGAQARHGAGGYVAQRRGSRCRPTVSCDTLSSRRSDRGLLLKRVPLVAVRASSAPPWEVRAAFGAYNNRKHLPFQ